MRNVHLQLSLVFSVFFFSRLFFFSPCTKKKHLLIILVVFHTLHDSIPFLLEVSGAKIHTIQSGVTLWIYTSV